jgi:hypothetical protein
MSRVLAVVEGHTEQTFVTNVLAPVLGSAGVYVSPRLVGKPGHKGGLRSYQKARKDIVAILKQDAGSYCTTMFDYNGLPTDWPEYAKAKAMPARKAVEQAERALQEDIRAELGSSHAGRLVPYVQLHEFEALLFSDPAALEQVIGQTSLAKKLHSIVKQCGEPEAIDDHAQTSPSKRIIWLVPGYQKVYHGALTVQRIGIAPMREKCPHFAAWVSRLLAASAINLTIGDTRTAAPAVRRGPTATALFGPWRSVPERREGSLPPRFCPIRFGSPEDSDTARAAAGTRG